jgi:hypothetical protein
MAEVQTAGGVQGVALHPESTILKAIKKYKLELLDAFEMIYFLRAAQDRPGLAQMLDEFQEVNEQLCLPMYGEAQTDWTLHEWMVENCHIVLEGELFHKFIAKVQPLYRSFYHKNPKTEYRQQVNNPKQVKKLRVYSRDEFPVLHICYTQTLMENCFK